MANKKDSPKKEAGKNKNETLKTDNNTPKPVITTRFCPIEYISKSKAVLVNLVRGKENVTDSSPIDFCSKSVAFIREIFQRESWAGKIIFFECLAIFFVLGGILYFLKTAYFRKTLPPDSISANKTQSLVTAKAGEEINDNSKNNEPQRVNQPQFADFGIDTSEWKAYRNDWYGILVRYPNDWTSPTLHKPRKGDEFEYKIEFRNSKEAEESLAYGVDVYIYPKNRKGIPQIEDSKLFTRDNYAYQLVPFRELSARDILEETQPVVNGNANSLQSNAQAAAKELELNVDALKIIAENQKADEEKIEEGLFPEFELMVKDFKLVDIKREKPKSAVTVKKITAKRPVSAKNVGGKLVCAKKNDKPRKSKKGKGKHLDLECCLDPDEYPNPWCSY